MVWAIEDIPGADQLFVRVHIEKTRLWSGTGVPPTAFRDTDQSCDWSRYSSVGESLARAINPAANGIAQIRASDAREVPGQVVVHAPDVARANRAHSHISGDKKRAKTDKSLDPEPRTLLAARATWALQVGSTGGSEPSA